MRFPANRQMCFHMLILPLEYRTQLSNHTYIGAMRLHALSSLPVQYMDQYTVIDCRVDRTIGQNCNVGISSINCQWTFLSMIAAPDRT